MCSEQALCHHTLGAVAAAPENRHERSVDATQASKQAIFNKFLAVNLNQASSVILRRRHYHLFLYGILLQNMHRPNDQFMSEQVL